MSSKVSVNTHLKILVTFADQLEKDCAIFLFVIVFADQKVVDSRLWTGFIERHVDTDFVSEFSLLFDFNGEASQDC